MYPASRLDCAGLDDGGMRSLADLLFPVQIKSHDENASSLSNRALL